MMDNEVIIDGCNVAECEYFDDADCFNPAEIVLSCEAEKNCLYKQLQRAKAENKELQKRILLLAEDNAINELRKLKATDKIEFKQYYKIENERLKAENEKLKQELQNLTAQIDR